ncbi:MAG: RNA polymerase sigma-54 factor, partial [Mesorhizobium sp.]
LTHVELERFIDEEIERNPLLERAEPQDDAGGDQPQKSETASEPAAGDDWFESETEWSAEAISEKLDSSLENLFPDDPGTSEKLGPDLTAQWKSASAGSAGGASSEGFDVGEMAATIVTLREHVGEQIALAFSKPAERLIAGELADSLDEAGYLRADLEEIAARLGADMGAVARALAVCQTFEPAGLFARDLAECLSLQLAARDRLDPAMKALVANLELLARRDFQTLKRICGVDEEDLLDMLAEIRALDPRPGTAFSGGASDAIVADVEVRAAADGSG